MALSTPDLFRNVHRNDFLGFCNDDSTDYRKVSDFLSLDKNDISKIAGVAKSSVRFDEKIPREVKERLDEIANVCQLVAEFFEGDEEKTALWFSLPNPLLGNISPRDMIRFGRYNKLLKFVTVAQEESRVETRKEKTK